MNAHEFIRNFEQDCLSFYEQIGSEAKTPDMKELYDLLADTQKTYLARLEEICRSFDETAAESSLLDRAEHLVNGCRLLLLKYDLTKEMKNDQDAFEHVVHAEEDLINMFEGMARAETGEAKRKMLAMLAESERKHLDEIEEIYEFVEKPRCYLEWGEFSNLGKL